MLSKHFDAIFIDFYGTICAGDREAVEATCARIVRECGLTISAGAFAIRWGEVFFATIEASNHDAFRTLYECEIVSLKRTLAEFAVRTDPVPFVAQLEAYWRNPPIHTDALDFLARVDVPVCCVSNADDAPLQQAIGRHGLKFDHVVTSEQARCYKPDPVIFERAVAALGCSVDRTIHIGDSLHSDIGGAHAAGIRSIWVERESRIHDIGHNGNGNPEFTVASLTDIIDRL